MKTVTTSTVEFENDTIVATRYFVPNIITGEVGYQTSARRVAALARRIAQDHGKNAGKATVAVMPNGDEVRTYALI